MTHRDDAATQRANLRYIRTSMDTPMLEKAAELDLARRWRDDHDEAALHELIRAYSRLVISTASRFRNYGLPLGDLIQEGNIGLMQAAYRFDPERDLRFSTYATWWVRSAIQDYVLRNWSIVRTGTTAAQKSLFFNLRRLRARIDSESGGLTTEDERREEISKTLHVSRKDVEEMETRMSGGDRSLNARIGIDGDEEWQSLLVDERPTPEDQTISRRDGRTRSLWLKEALNSLNDRERSIIRRRHLATAPSTLEELGHDFGVSKERIRQIEQRAMEKLKVSLSRKVSNGTDLLTAS